MTPTPGDVFAQFDERLRAYVVVQVTALQGAGKDAMAAVVLFDWLGPEPPAAEEVQGLQAVVHVWAPVRVPRRFVHIGTVAPVLADTPHAHGGWPNGRRMWARLRRDRVPQDVRERYDAAERDNDRTVVMELDGRELTRAQRRLDAGHLTAGVEHAVFDAFPLVRAVSTDRPVPGLVDFLRRRHLVYEASLRGHGERVVDLRGTHLTRLLLDMTGVEELHLDDSLDNLGLVGPFVPGVRVHAEDNGRWLSLAVTGDLPATWSGLDAVRSLLVREFRELDVDLVVKQFPALTSLTISGAPGYLRNVYGLAALPLEDLSLNNVFGYGPADFPDDFPELEQLSLASIPADVAASVKAKYGGRPDLDLDVRQPRKPEWLAANLDNPFREWDGAEHITAAQAKKAAALYRQTRAAALKSSTVPALTAIATTYVEGFTKLGSRSAFIDTDERERIMDALGDILDAVESITAADRTAIFDAADRLRDF
jgi:hypothetical protein